MAKLAFTVAVIAIWLGGHCCADDFLKNHCGDCHSGSETSGNFDLNSLGKQPNHKNLKLWLACLNRVSAGEMPPPDQVSLSSEEQSNLSQYFDRSLGQYAAASKPSRTPIARRMNNREFRQSVCDVLLIEDVGTHQPTDNLIGDSLYQGFDTHAETLGFSKFHLEQYIHSIRKIVDATILTKRESPKLIRIAANRIFEAQNSQNTQRKDRRGKPDGFDFLDPQLFAYFAPFKTASHTGRYKIKIRCTGKDRGYYDAEQTGIYDDEPIRLAIHLGDRQKTFDLPDDTVKEITLDEWIAAGTRLRFSHPTDGLRLRNNGNFKFQYAIAGEYIKENQPELYDQVVANIKNTRFSNRSPRSWHHWVQYWRGPRPRIISATIEGPFYESWPPSRQIALIGDQPTVSRAAEILKPIAQRAWRRPVANSELEPIVALVQSKANELGDVAALKEGIVSILVSPEFLFIHSNRLSSQQRFISKLAYLLHGSIPNQELAESASKGALDSYDGIVAALKIRAKHRQLDSFERAFPFGWLKLNDINFMAPDPDRYRFYHRKRISEDMVEEVLHFFRHVMDNNLPITEFLSADYSFINQDLARIYDASGVPNDSVFRRYKFDDGRRGGLLGMGAFLTVTADSLATSPIHRAVYVMENFLGIHPTPPPADVEITEPDVRQAVTIKEVLNQHRSDQSCSACHQRIDPYGYAFENYGPAGQWRDSYEVNGRSERSKKKNSRQGSTIPIDASAVFPNGTKYSGITEFKQVLLTPTNRERFVRCFVTKLLTYANGKEPADADFAEVDKIVAISAEHDYRILETIAAVIDSPLFREQ